MRDSLGHSSAGKFMEPMALPAPPTTGPTAVGIRHGVFMAVLAVGSMPMTVGVAPTLCGHIAHIVGLSTQEQMGRIYADPVIATVQNRHTRWHGTEVHFPRHAMGGNVALIASNNPVAMVGADPEPAIVSLSNLGPKAVSQWSARAECGHG